MATSIDPSDGYFLRFQSLLDQLAIEYRTLGVESMQFRAAADTGDTMDYASRPPVDGLVRFQNLLNQLASEYRVLCDENRRLAFNGCTRAPVAGASNDHAKFDFSLIAPEELDFYESNVQVPGERSVFDTWGPAVLASLKPEPCDVALVDPSDFADVDCCEIHLERLSSPPDSHHSVDSKPSYNTRVVDPEQEKKDLEQKERMMKNFSTAARSFIASDAESVENMLGSAEAGSDQLVSGWSFQTFFGKGVNKSIIRGSALGLRKSLQFLVWLIALGGVTFVLWATYMKLGADSTSHAEESSTGGCASDGHRRRLGAEAATMLKHIAYALLGAGLMAILINLLKQPLILGYLLGGVLVGPEIGLGLVDNHEDISQISSLGLLFLLFMIGLELNVMELLKMGKVVLVTGALQFPLCAGLMFAIFMGFSKLDISFGNGDYSVLYCGVTCGISSTMIVVKLLSEKGQTDSRAGRLTVGILIFQDIWAIIMLAIQPTIANPEVLGILKTFGWIAVLVSVAMLYAKFVMPAVFVTASKNVELMLVLALSWCFFICSFAILPFIGLSMELASLIAGVALAAFPYSAEFNGKIKYIRDFFVTLFFVALGMQIPIPTFDAVRNGMLIAIVVVLVRWIGICCLVLLMGGGARLAVLSTLNLSQISEFALVICKLGQNYGHIEHDTMAIITWTFAILAVFSSYLIGFNLQIFKFMNSRRNAIVARQATPVMGDDDDEERTVVFLGFHRVAFDLMSEFQRSSPQMLKRMHVIDVDGTMMPKLRAKGIKCSYGDISSVDVLEHLHFGGEEDLIISTVPDSILQGVTNMQLLRVAQHVFPRSHYILTADTPAQANQLYAAGAHYVIGMAKLSAERLHDLLSEHYTQAFGGELVDTFEGFRSKDHSRRGNSGLLRGNSAGIFDLKLF